MNTKAWTIAAALLSAGVAQATCYSVYNAKGALIQEGPNTPVNLALPLGDSVPEKFGEGASMTMTGLDVYCKARKGPAALRKTGAAKGAKVAVKKEPAPAAQDLPAAPEEPVTMKQEPAEGQVETADAR